MGGHAWALTGEDEETLSFQCECKAEKVVSRLDPRRLLSYRRGQACAYTKGRRTLADIERYPPPQELYEELMSKPGYPYRVDPQGYLLRDRALVSVLYLCCLRVSEALRLRVGQFRGEGDRIHVDGIQLSKVRRRGSQRRERFREAWLPRQGERAPFTELVLTHLRTLGEDPETRLFPIGRQHAHEVVAPLTGRFCHMYRAFGEEFLYSAWRGDLLAVSDYVKVSPQTLAHYIRKRYLSHPTV